MCGRGVVVGVRWGCRGVVGGGFRFRFTRFI